MAYVLYDYLPSGNGYKCRLTMKALGIPYELVQMNIVAGATRTPEFLKINREWQGPGADGAGARAHRREPRDHQLPRRWLEARAGGRL